MTRLRQFTAAALALTLSGALHAAGFIRLAPQTDVALQGGAAQTLPTLGESFADMAQGAAFAAPASGVGISPTRAREPPPPPPPPPVQAAAPEEATSLS